MQHDAAGLLNDERAGSHVPTLDAQLKVGVSATLSYSALVQRRRGDHYDTVHLTEDMFLCAVLVSAINLYYTGMKVQYTVIWNESSITMISFQYK